MLWSTAVVYKAAHDAQHQCPKDMWGKMKEEEKKNAFCQFGDLVYDLRAERTCLLLLLPVHSWVPTSQLRGQTCVNISNTTWCYGRMDK